MTHQQMVLACKHCGHRPDPESVMGTLLLHFQVEHDTDKVSLELVVVCRCGASMTHNYTEQHRAGFVDYFDCLACHRSTTVRRAPDVPRLVTSDGSKMPDQVEDRHHDQDDDQDADHGSVTAVSGDDKSEPDDQLADPGGGDTSQPEGDVLPGQEQEDSEQGEQQGDDLHDGPPTVPPSVPPTD